MIDIIIYRHGTITFADHYQIESYDDLDKCINDDNEDLFIGSTILHETWEPYDYEVVNSDTGEIIIESNENN